MKGTENPIAETLTYRIQSIQIPSNKRSLNKLPFFDWYIVWTGLIDKKQCIQRPVNWKNFTLLWLCIDICHCQLTYWRFSLHFYNWYIRNIHQRQLEWTFKKLSRDCVSKWLIYLIFWKNASFSWNILKMTN